MFKCDWFTFITILVALCFARAGWHEKQMNQRWELENKRLELEIKLANKSRDNRGEAHGPDGSPPMEPPR